MLIKITSHDIHSSTPGVTEIYLNLDAITIIRPYDKKYHVVRLFNGDYHYIDKDGLSKIEEMNDFKKTSRVFEGGLGQ